MNLKLMEHLTEEGKVALMKFVDVQPYIVISVIQILVGDDKIKVSTEVFKNFLRTSDYAKQWLSWIDNYLDDKSNEN